MSRETYQKITDYIREEPRRVQILRSVNLLLTGFIFLLYPLFLFVLFSRKDPFLQRSPFSAGSAMPPAPTKHTASRRFSKRTPMGCPFQAVMFFPFL